MKKTVFAVMVILIMTFVLCGCGSSGPQSYAGFYSANIPEGFVTDEYETEFTRESDVYEGEKEKIQVYVRYGDAEEEINSSVDYWADTSSPHKRVDDVTYGDITWYVETYTWDTWDVDDVACCTFYTDAGDGDFIEINCFLMAHDSEEVVSMMESFTFEEGAYDKSLDFISQL